MDLAAKIAWRNLWRHKGKSLVIGVILFIGALLMTVGNGMISGMEKGLSENIVNLFTGDIVVISNEQDNDDVLFEMMGKPIKVIKDYPAAKKIMENQKMIKGFLPATAGMVLVFNSGSEMGYMMLLGVDLARYRQFFPGSFGLSEGQLFKPGERGVLVAEESRQQAYDSMNFWLVPEKNPLKLATLPQDLKKDHHDLEVRRDVVFMGTSDSNTSVDVRVPVKAIMKYRSLNKIWGIYSIIDIQSFREAHNYVTGEKETVAISKEQKQLLESNELDALFSSETSLTDASALTDETITVKDLQAKTQKKPELSNTDNGSYNVIFLKTNPGAKPEKVIQTLNAAFKKQSLKLRAVSWKEAVGTYGSMAAMIKGALNLFIMFIFFVAVIVIMNTLSMAALERVSEIGMMRAIGARISFVRKMFIYETGLLSFFFGGLGIVTGIVIIFLINSANITTTNELLQLVYGGDRLNPLFTVGDLMLGIFELLFVTFVAVVYPLRVVGKIVPLDAIARE